MLMSVSIILMKARAVQSVSENENPKVVTAFFAAIYFVQYCNLYF
jgi:hypothetical protein